MTKQIVEQFSGGFFKSFYSRSISTISGAGRVGAERWDLRIFWNTQNMFLYNQCLSYTSNETVNWYVELLPKTLTSLAAGNDSRTNAATWCGNVWLSIASNRSESSHTATESARCSTPSITCPKNKRVRTVSNNTYNKNHKRNILLNKRHVAWYRCIFCKTKNWDCTFGQFFLSQLHFLKEELLFDAWVTQVWYLRPSTCE